MTVKISYNSPREGGKEDLSCGRGDHRHPVSVIPPLGRWRQADFASCPASLAYLVSSKPVELQKSKRIKRNKR